MLELRLYLLQRLSAALMAPLVLLHLAVMIYAIQGGLSADEILARTRGNLFWGSAYGMFVVLVSLHAAIGLRNIMREWWSLRGMPLNVLCGLVGIGLLLFGARAVMAVVIGG